MEEMTRSDAMADYAEDWEDHVWENFMAEHMPHIDPTEFSRRDLAKVSKTNVGVVLWGLWDAYLWEADDER